MTVRIVEYDTGRDEEPLRDLLAAFVAFYRQPPSDVDALSAARAGKPGLGLLLGYAGDRAVGFASYAELWPARSNTTLFLKELFVRSEERDRGTGAAFMQALVAEARRRGCDRVEWMTETDNDAARRFYDRLPTRIMDKVVYRLDL